VTFRAFRGIDFTIRLRWLFDLLKPRAIAGGANNLSQNFKRSFHRDQSLKQKKVEIICAKIAASRNRAT
jgi:succinylglutamate desuccinylase